MREYLTQARKLAEKIMKHDNITIVSHIDADGITSAAIASSSLDSIGKNHEVLFLKQLDPDTLNEIRKRNSELYWFTDLGSGMVHEMHGMNVVITDHHSPSDLIPNVPREKRRTLTELFDEINREDIIQLNPHLFGKDGGIDISGAGVTYLVARELNPSNVRLSVLAIVGAVGDLQDIAFLRLTGTNRYILKEAEEFGLLRTDIDARFFGRETRPVHKMLEYVSDPILPGITGDERGAIEFLKNLSIPLKDGDKWRRWVDLTSDEKRMILSSLVKNIILAGYGGSLAERMVGEVYTLIKEEEGTYLRDAREFATLLNACGRYGDAMTGFHVAKGDRDEEYRKAVSLLQKHRKIILDGIDYLKDIGISKMPHLQYFHAGSNIPDTVIGTIASIVLSSEIADPTLPIIGFAENEYGTIKVSGRAPRNLVERGLDLSRAIKEAALAVGGNGGGHNVAAGGSIPRGKENEFVGILDEIIRRQLGS
ncbi:MAG: DHHA1 domain-containing protein [Thermoplasmata archaeon]